MSEYVSVLDNDTAGKLISKYNALTDATEKQAFAQNNFKQSIDQEAFSRYIKSVGNGIPTAEGYAKATKEAADAQKKFTTSLSGVGIKGFLSSFARGIGSIALNMAAFALIDVAINGAITLFDRLNETAEETIERGKEAQKAITDARESYSTKKSTIENFNVNNYADMKSQVNAKSNANETLSADQYQEYLNISNELAEIFPQLVQGYDAQGNAILNLSDDADTATQSLADLLEQERQLANYKISENLQDAYDGIKVQSDQLDTQIEKLKAMNAEIEGTKDLLTEDVSDEFTKPADNALQFYLSSEQEGLDKFETKLQAYKKALKNTGLDVNSYLQEYLETGVGGSYVANDILIDLTEEQRKDFLREYKNQCQILGVEASATFAETMGEIQLNEAQKKTVWAGLIPSMQSYVSTLGGFLNISEDKNVQETIINGINSLIGDFDVTKLNSSDFEAMGNDIYGWIADEFFSGILSVSEDNKEVAAKALANLFTLDSNNLTTEEASKKVESYLDAIYPDAEDLEEREELKLKLGITMEVDTDNDGITDKVINAFDYKKQVIAEKLGASENFMDDWSIGKIDQAYDRVINGFSGAIQRLSYELDHLDDVSKDNTFAEIFANTEDGSISASIDEYQDALSKLQTAQDNLRNGKLTGSVLTDLYQDFPELINQTDNLGSALNKLSAEKASKAIASIRNAMKEMTDPAELAGGESLIRSILDTLDFSDADLAEVNDRIWSIFTPATDNPRDERLAINKINDFYAEFDAELGTEKGREILLTLLADPANAELTLAQFREKYSNEEIIYDIKTNNENITRLENDLNRIQDEAKSIQDEMSLKEAEGKSLNENDYTEAIAKATEEIDKYNELIDEQEEKQKNILRSGGSIDSEEYLAASAAIRSYNSSISALEISQLEWNEAIENLPLNDLSNRLTELQAEAQNVEEALSLKEAKGIKPLVSDYQKLIQNSEAQVWNLKKQNVELQKQLVGLDENSSKYQEIQSQINSNVSAINQARISQIEWNEAASRLNYEPGEGLTAYNKAKETRNAGDNYVDMMSGLKEAKELYDKGLIGIDDFQEYARMISPSGAIDPANFLENYGKVSKWFTEGTDGVKTFLNELDTKGLAEFNEETQQWTWNIEDMAKAANEMGVSEEVMTAMFGRLQDYGFDNNYVSSVADGVQRLSNLYADLAREQALLEEMESKPSEYTPEQINSKKELIESIVSNIEATGQSMGYVVENAGEAANAQIESAKSAIETLAEQREKILKDNTYGENTEAVAKQLENQILGLAEENGLQLDLEYNVIGKEDIVETTDALKSLQENGQINIDLNFDKSEMSSEELQTKIDELTEASASIDVTTEGGQEALDEINAIISSLETEKKLKIALESGSTIEELLDLTDEELANTLQIDTSQIEAAKLSLQQLEEETNIPITVQIADEQFTQLVNDEKTVTVDSSSVDEAQNKLDQVNETKLDNKSFYISSNLSSVESYLSSVKRSLDLLDGKTSTIKINKVTTEILQKSMGTFSHGTLTPAYASGTAYNVINMRPAYANGRKVALDHDETALVNELGTEGLIRDGKLYEIPGGMHYQSLKKGDMILSVEQMKQLNLTGKASGKAKAYADGTIGNIPLMNAYGGSTIGGGNFQGGAATSPDTSNLQNAINNLGNSFDNSTEKISKLEKALEELDKLFDWIEVKLDRIQRNIDYDTALSENAVGYEAKNTYISSAQTNTKALIQANTKGAKKYQAQADKVAKQVGLSDKLYNRIKDGSINIQSLSEDDKKRVDAVKQWYDKMLDCQQAIEDLKASQRELAQTKLDNITNQYDAMLAHLEHSANMINGFMEQAELKGLAESTEYYNSLITNAESSISDMQAERSALLQSLQESVDSGIITVGSVEWYEMQSQINDVTLAIQEADTSILEFNDKIRQIEWDRFDKEREAVNRLTEEADFLIDLMSTDDLFDDKGRMTDQGMAITGLHGQNYNVYMEQANAYRDEMNRINEELQKKENQGNTKLIERREELLDLQRDSILAAEDEKQAIKDLVQEGIEKELDTLQELIDKYKDALDSQKDLNDYQKDVSDKAKEVAAIQKQLKAYENDDSEEGRAKRQELQNSLKEAQEELEQTEYDKYISDQKELLDELYTEYDDTLNQRLDNIDQLMNDMIQTINTNASSIADTLSAESKAVGYSLTEEMESIWGDNGSATGVLSTYSENFSNTMTTVQTTIDGIAGYLSQLVNLSDEQAKKDINISTTNNPDNQSIEGKTPTSSNGSGNGNKANSTEEGSKDDEIIKIIKSGKTGKDYIAKQRKAKNHSKLWTYIVDKYGHVPTYEIYKKLGKRLGVKAPKDYKVASETDALLKALKKKGYATGTPRVGKEDNYWTNENGQEYIIRKSDGAVLQRLFPGDKVLNAQASENMYNFAVNPERFMNDLNISNLSSVPFRSSGGSISNSNAITFNLPQVKNYEEFVTAMQHDKKFEEMIQNMTVGRINGKSSLNKYKHKF